MELQRITCRQCGAAIPFAVGATHLKCEFCGTEYVLRQDGARGGGVGEVDYLGRGPLFRCFVPQGWSVRVIKDEDSESYQATVCRGLRLDSPDGARLLFYPFAYYRHFEPGKLSLHRDYQLDPVSGTRYRRRVPLAQYVSERVAELFGQTGSLTVTPVPAGELLERRAAVFAEDASRALKRQTAAEQGKFEIGFTVNGVGYRGYMASALAAVKAQEPSRPEPVKQEAPAKKSGGRGVLDKIMNYKGVLGGPSLSDISQSVQNGGGRELLGAIGAGGAGLLSGATSGANWGRAFDFVLIAPTEDAARYERIFDEFCARLEYCALYFTLQDEETQKIQQIILDGMRQRQQISINASQRLHRTLSETSDIINEGYRQRSATMDDISRRQSEAVRGVNTYTDRCGRDVEADVRYERVFQRGSDYAGSTSAGAEPGGDWEELKRR